MPKTKAVVLGLLFCLVGLLSFGPSNNTGIEKGVERGDVLKNNRSEVGAMSEYLKAANGNYVLVNFWASYDAESHISNIRLANMSKRLNEVGKGDSLCFISVSLDRFESVSTQTLVRDGLTHGAYLTLTEGFNSLAAKSLKMNEGEFQNFLLDPQGVIVGKNMKESEISAYLETLANM